MKAKITFNLFIDVLLRKFSLQFLLISLGIYSFYRWHPMVFDQYYQYVICGFIIVLVYIFYSTYNISKDIVSHVNYKLELEEKMRLDNAEELLVSELNFYKNLVEINKVSLDIYKSFSPISIIVFILGIIIKWDFEKLFKYIGSFFIVEIEFNYFVILILLFVLVLYFISFRKKWVYHENLLNRYSEVRTAYEKLKIRKNKF